MNRNDENRELRFSGLRLTVSGDWQLRHLPDFIREMCRNWRVAAEESALYEAALIGAADRLFGLKEINEALNEEIYHRYREKFVLLPMTLLCLDAAVWRPLAEERPGIPAMREAAFRSLIRTDHVRLTHTFWGGIEEKYLRSQLPGGNFDSSDVFQEQIAVSAKSESAEELVKNAVILFRLINEDGFAEKLKGHHDLGLDTPGRESSTGQDNHRVTLRDHIVPSLVPSNAVHDGTMRRLNAGALVIDDSAMARVAKSVEDNYGRSFLKAAEQARIEKQLCRGPHEGCHLHFTKGPDFSALSADGRLSALDQFHKKIADENRALLRENAEIVRESVRRLADSFRNALFSRQESERYRATFGEIRPERLWNLGRTKNEKLFDRNFEGDDSQFVIDLLIDASGSQIPRQGMVALQGYILSRALSLAGIPHRVTAFCTFGDYTVMRRYRDFDDPDQADERIFDYYGSGNNRDGLAVQAAALTLREREEENRIMIVLSDGTPNDIIMGRVRSKEHPVYSGNYAVRDTAFAVRDLRKTGIRVMGIFVGEEDALQDERLVFGSSFAFIRDIESFSGTASRFLKSELEG